MSNELQVFNSEEFGKIRVSGTPDYPLFCLADLCKMLEIGNPSDVKNRLGDGVVSIEVIFDALGRKQNAAFVNEDGLYDVILDSRKPEARRIRKWITSEVMPSIRKHGVYATDDFIQKAIASPEWGIKVLTELQNKNEQIVMLNQQVAEMAPKAGYYDLAMNSDKLLTTTMLAENYGYSAQALNKVLEENDIQYKDRQDNWHLKMPYKSYGWGVSTREIITLPNGKKILSTQLKWTVRGERELKELLRRKGLLLILEKDSLLN